TRPYQEARVKEPLSIARRRAACIRGLLLVVALAGCGTGATRPVARHPVCAVACSLGSGTTRVSVFVEPEAGAAPILAALASASRAIDVETYQLSDTRVIHALEDAANRGMAVRVILEFAPLGDAGIAAQVTAEELRTAGIQVESGNPAFRYTHAKIAIIDGATAYILSGNLTHAGLGGSVSGTDRDYGVVDTDSTDVADLRALFAADWARTSAHPTAPNLVISPDNARAKLLALIGRARSTLAIEDEELQDGAIEAALSAAAQRGVVVRVILPAPANGGTPSAQTAQLARARVWVRSSGHLYMHAKMVLVDDAEAFVGSVNFSATSLDANREIGVLLAAPIALNLLSSTFTADWQTSIPA
ncbi:MAG TPA: phospholipase D-like domain-containing protein, partial [Ktedonobacterales bacterium]